MGNSGREEVGRSGEEDRGFHSAYLILIGTTTSFFGRVVQRDFEDMQYKVCLEAVSRGRSVVEEI